jgi:hypothetical protein
MSIRSCLLAAQARATLMLALVGTLGCATAQPQEPLPGLGAQVPVAFATPPRVDQRACAAAGKSIVVVHRDAAGRADRWRYFQTMRRRHRSVKALTCELADSNHDGLVDARYFYGADGQLVVEQRDLDFDGRPEVTADYSQFRMARAGSPRGL